jgi:hypothetical protein
MKPTHPIKRLDEAKKQIALVREEVEDERSAELATALVRVERIRTELQQEEVDG